MVPYIYIYIKINICAYAAYLQVIYSRGCRRRIDVDEPRRTYTYLYRDYHVYVYHERQITRAHVYVHSEFSSSNQKQQFSATKYAISGGRSPIGRRGEK